VIGQCFHEPVFHRKRFIVQPRSKHFGTQRGKGQPARTHRRADPEARIDFADQRPPRIRRATNAHPGPGSTRLDVAGYLRCNGGQEPAQPCEIALLVAVANRRVGVVAVEGCRGDTPAAGLNT